MDSAQRLAVTHFDQLDPAHLRGRWKRNWTEGITECPVIRSDVYEPPNGFYVLRRYHDVMESRTQGKLVLLVGVAPLTSTSCQTM